MFFLMFFQRCLERSRNRCCAKVRDMIKRTPHKQSEIWEGGVKMATRSPKDLEGGSGGRVDFFCSFKSLPKVGKMPKPDTIMVEKTRMGK